MFRNSLYLGRILGIPVRIHISWLIIFILITVSLAADYFPQEHPSWSLQLDWVVGILTSFLFFASVLLHELAHSVVAVKQGSPVHDIVLFIFGGVSELSEEPKSPAKEFVMALAGPLTSFAIGILFGILWLITRASIEPVAAISKYLAYINILLGAFNLIPGFPLDGGRVLRAILWGLKGNLSQATRWASAVGQGVAFLFIFAGIWLVFAGHWINGLWIAFIGWFLDNAAMSSYRQVALQSMVAGHTVREAMSTDYPELQANVTLEELVLKHVLGSGRRAFPIKRENQLVGLLTLHNIRMIPRERWQTATVEQAMIPIDQVKTISPNSDLWQALQEMTSEGVNQLLVTENGNMVGILARDNILTFIRTLAELGM